MLKVISIKNIKSLRNIEVKLKPITFLLGKNSSGKSSLLQSLLLIKQTMESRDMNTSIVPRGNYVDLGSFLDIVYGRDHHRTFSINLTFSPRETDKIIKLHLDKEIYDRYRFPYYRKMHRYRFLTDIRKLSTEISLNIEYSFNLMRRRIDLKELKFYTKNKNLLFIAEKIKDDPVLYNVTYFKETSNRTINIIWKNVELKKFYLPRIYPYSIKKPKIIVVKGQKYKTYRTWMVRNAAMIINSISDELEKELYFFSDNLIHIDPIREKPKKTYIHTGEKKETVGLRREAAVDVLYAEKNIGDRWGDLWAQKNDKSVKPKIEESEMIQNVMRWLKKLDMASDFDFPGLFGYAYLFMLRHPSLKIESNIADHGFGLSQVLPIIVQGFYSAQGSLLLLEQPEIHLHPKAQADLAEMIVEISNRNVNCIIETHSEHIIERLQLLVARNPLLLKKISILLFQIKKDGTEISELKLSENGKRINWPKDFADGFLNGGLYDAIELEKINMLKRKEKYQERLKKS